MFSLIKINFLFLLHLNYVADSINVTSSIIAGKNPRPVCVPVPRLPAVKACIKFYNIYFQGRNVHACVNMEGKFRDTTLFKVSNTLKFHDFNTYKYLSC